MVNHSVLGAKGKKHCLEYLFFDGALYEVFYIKIWFKCEVPLLFFQIKTMIYRKKNNRKKYEKILNYMLTYMTSHAVWVDEVMGVMVSIKKSIKTKTYWKNSFLK